MDEYQIVELVKDWYRTTSIKADDNFLLNDRTIMSIKSYERLYEHNPSISKQVIGYIYNDRTNVVSELKFPMLKWDFISEAYLYKKGYVITEYGPFSPAPLPNLKYIIDCIASGTGITQFEFQDKLVIELVDVDVVADNINLSNIVWSVLGTKLLSKNKIIKYAELNDIKYRLYREKLFAGHRWGVAELIVHRYFDENKRKLSKEVLKISEAYQRVFRPYSIIYNTKTWQPVVF
jgi:hypothetical protein